MSIKSSRNVFRTKEFACVALLFLLFMAGMTVSIRMVEHSSELYVEAGNLALEVVAPGFIGDAEVQFKATYELLERGHAIIFWAKVLAYVSIFMVIPTALSVRRWYQKYQ